MKLILLISLIYLVCFDYGTSFTFSGRSQYYTRRPSISGRNKAKTFENKYEKAPEGNTEDKLTGGGGGTDLGGTDLGGTDLGGTDLGGTDLGEPIDTGGLPPPPGGQPSGATENCECVPYYQCDSKNQIITSGIGLIDPRQKKKVEDKELDINEHYVPPYCGGFSICCTKPTEKPVQPYIHKCGVRNPSGINRRILSPDANQEADFGEWPWQAAILKVEKDLSIYQCGGVLIDDHHILTIAHCVYKFVYDRSHRPTPYQGNLKVRLGEWDTQNTEEFLPHEDFKVSDVIIHEKFNGSNLWNDIALLKLENKVKFRPNIDSICLPSHEGNYFNGHDCVTTGWGKDKFQGGSYSNILKEIKVPVVDNYDCQSKLRTTRLGYFFRLHDSFMCAGGKEGKDSCKGDGGGPLVCFQKDGSYGLVGLVAWGIDCGQRDVPGVYVRVEKYLNWISENTGHPLGDYLSPTNRQG